MSLNAYMVLSAESSATYHSNFTKHAAVRLQSQLTLEPSPTDLGTLKQDVSSKSRREVRAALQASRNLRQHHTEREAFVRTKRAEAKLAHVSAACL